MTTYEKISFEEATRIIYYHWSERPGLFKEFMEELMSSSDPPYMTITPRQYQEYKQFLTENKKSR